MDFQNQKQVELSQVQKFYTDKSIFITGATGFVGKTVAEKLLRACPNVKSIYILLRPKKSFSIEERVNDFVASSIFEKLRESNSNFSQKLIPIKGDVALPDIGLSNDDQCLLQEKVHVVVHSAACIKFNEFIKTALDINFHGTRKVLQLCKTMKQLEAFVHVSTAYTNAERTSIEEIVYPFASKKEIENLISEIDSMDDEMAEKMTKSIIGDKPNTYVFTKALVENYLDFYKETVPVCIVRPSIVTATIKEPVEGWVDNVNVVSGLMIFCGKGLLRSLRFHKWKHVDFMPVDYLANLIIVAGWNCQRSRLARLQETHTVEDKNEIVVFNCCAQSPIKISDYVRLSVEAINKYPFDNVVWCPNMIGTEWPLIQWFRDLVYHRIPAHCMDLFLPSQYKNKQISMVRLYNRIQASIGAFEHFMTHEWKFYTNNVQRLHRTLTAQDHELFPLFVRNIDWKEYLNNYVVGLRRYTLNEDDSNLPTARQNVKRKFLLQRILQVLLRFPVIIFFHFAYKPRCSVLLPKLVLFYQLYKPIVESIAWLVFKY